MGGVRLERDVAVLALKNSLGLGPFCVDNEELVAPCTWLPMRPEPPIELFVPESSFEMESAQGFALVASPYLTDPHFLRSVVYILRHDEEGAIGLILNRPTHATIGNFLQQSSGENFDNERPVYYGGPVEGPLMLLQECTQGDEPSIFISSDPERILDICDPQRSVPAGHPKHCGGEYRVFDGYAGWAPEQLDDELREGGWLIWHIEPAKIFGNCEGLWKTAIEQIGRDILSGGIDFSKMLGNPANN